MMVMMKMKMVVLLMVLMLMVLVVIVGKMIADDSGGCEPDHIRNDYVEYVHVMMVRLRC